MAFVDGNADEEQWDASDGGSSVYTSFQPSNPPPFQLAAFPLNQADIALQCPLCNGWITATLIVKPASWRSQQHQEKASEVQQGRIARLAAARSGFLWQPGPRCWNDPQQSEMHPRSLLNVV